MHSISSVLRLFILSEAVWTVLGQARPTESGRVLSIESLGAIPDANSPVLLLHRPKQGQKHGLIKILEKLLKKAGTVTTILQEACNILNSTEHKLTPQELDQALQNTAAFNQTLTDAHPGDTVLIPDGKTFSMFGGIVMSDKTDVTIDFAGSINFVYDLNAWPYGTTLSSPMQGGGLTNSYDPGILVRDCDHVTVTSSSNNQPFVTVSDETNKVSIDTDKGTGGMINGNGQKWWWSDILQCFHKGKEHRPKLLYVMNSQNVLVEYLTLVNAPYWTFPLEAVNAEAHHINIYVDGEFQIDLLDKKRKMTARGQPKWRRILKSHLWTAFRSSPIGTIREFLHLLHRPQELNTDGIDPSGRNIHIHDCIISNSDDSIAVKPLHRGQHGIMPNCTTDILIEDTTLTGFGASIGSVHPNADHSCIDNVTFRNIKMPGTGRGIYIKPDGSDCQNDKQGNPISGQITNIVYDTVTISEPIWWPIWIGPQQQHQPGSRLGDKCALSYPILSDHCPTPKCVTVKNITITNVKIEKPIWPWTGAIKGNESNPFESIVFDNVTTSKRKLLFGFPLGFFWKPKYFSCENAHGTYSNSKPAPQCLDKEEGDDSKSAKKRKPMASKPPASEGEL